jgi:hypothetical protein
MVIKVNINSDCDQILHYRNMGKLIPIPKSKNRFADYDIEKLSKELANKKVTTYIYKIQYSDGKISIVTTTTHPLGELVCQ